MEGPPHAASRAGQQLPPPLYSSSIHPPFGVRRHAAAFTYGRICPISRIGRIEPTKFPIHNKAEREFHPRMPSRGRNPTLSVDPNSRHCSTPVLTLAIGRPCP